jgi:hypothetical protein
VQPHGGDDAEPSPWTQPSPPPLQDTAEPEASGQLTTDGRCGVCHEPKRGVGDVRHLQCLTDDELATCLRYWQTRQSGAAASGHPAEESRASNSEDAWSRYMTSVRLSAVLRERRSRRTVRRQTRTRRGAAVPFGP